MANNCYNFIIVEGSLEILDEIEAKLRDATENMKNSLYFETYHKVFKDPHLLPEPDDKFDVYDEYGSKWFEIGDISGEFDLEISGDSAWSPVVAFCQKLSDQYKVNVRIEYEEPGSDIGGFSCFENGVLTEYMDTSYVAWRFEQDGMDFLLSEIEYIGVEDFWDVYKHFKEVFPKLSSTNIKELIENFKNLNN
jgi:hypothetical protein